MYKKLTICLASTALLLSACGGVNPEYKKGEALYEKGDYNSLVKAREYFESYAAKHPDDSKVNEYFTKIDKALIQKAKEKTDQAYSNRDIENAMKYITVAKQVSPSDASIKKAYGTIKTAYDNQMIYNNFASYLEDRYIEAKDITDQWDKALNSVKTGNNALPYAKDVAKSLYPKIVNLRNSVNTESFNLTGDDQATFRDINSSLFDYVLQLQDNASQVMANTNAQTVDDYQSLAKSLDPETFNTTFVSIQNNMSQYVAEKDSQGKEVRHIEDTLNFSKAYKEKTDSLNATKNTQPQSKTKSGSNTK